MAAPLAARPRILDRVAAVLGRDVVGWQRPECGLVRGRALAGPLDDGSCVLVKAATDAETAGWVAKRVSRSSSSCRAPPTAHGCRRPLNLPCASQAVFGLEVDAIAETSTV